MPHDEKHMVSLNVLNLDRIVAEAQPKFAAKLTAKQPSAIMTAAGIVQPAGPIDTALLSFCAAWPKVRIALNLGLKFAAWFLPASQIALAKAVLTAINDEIVPVICKPEV